MNALLAHYISTMLYFIPYSGKFSNGAKFRIIRKRARVREKFILSTYGTRAHARVKGRAGPGDKKGIVEAMVRIAALFLCKTSYLAVSA